MAEKNSWWSDRIIDSAICCDACYYVNNLLPVMSRFGSQLYSICMKTNSSEHGVQKRNQAFKPHHANHRHSGESRKYVMYLQSTISNVGHYYMMSVFNSSVVTFTYKIQFEIETNSGCWISVPDVEKEAMFPQRGYEWPQKWEARSYFTSLAKFVSSSGKS